MTEPGVLILTGPDAEEAFGHLLDRDSERMREQTRAAFAEICSLIATMRGFKPCNR